MKKSLAILAVFSLSVSCAFAQVQIGGHIYVPSTSDSTLGMVNANFTADGDCDVSTQTNCALTTYTGGAAGPSGPFVGTMQIQDYGHVLTGPHLITLPASPGRTYNLVNNTAYAITESTSGATLAPYGGSNSFFTLGSTYVAAGGGCAVGTVAGNFIPYISSTSPCVFGQSNLEWDSTNNVTKAGDATAPSDLPFSLEGVNDAGVYQDITNDHSDSSPASTWGYGVLGLFPGIPGHTNSYEAYSNGGSASNCGLFQCIDYEDIDNGTTVEHHQHAAFSLDYLTTVPASTPLCPSGPNGAIGFCSSVSGVTFTSVTPGYTLVCSTSVTCLQGRGSLHVTTPVTPSAGPVGIVGFANPFATNPMCLITQNFEGTDPPAQVAVGTTSVITTSFTLSLGVAPVGSSTYVFNYICLE